MSTWETRRAWLKDLPWPAPEHTKAPVETASAELDRFFRGENERAECIVDSTLGDGYELTKTDGAYIVRGGPSGILYGAYALIRAVLCKSVLPDGVCQPYYPWRMLNAWDNMAGDIERGYAGRSLWFEGNQFSYEPARIRQLGRMLASVGINVLCINNVNVIPPAQQLPLDLLDEVRKFATLLRPFGVRLMLSIDFSLPAEELGTADPLDPRVAKWWAETAERIWNAIPDFAGFLVKADSEHRPGPRTYGRTHAEGANMLARAVRPYGAILVWRAFVYNCMQDWRDTSTDRPCAAFDLYKPLDGAFDDNVILQIKNGPFDFQVREPVSPLFLSMDHTPLGLELQLAQEYTGQQIDLYTMPPMWREFFDEMGKERVKAIAAVGNLGRDECWTGHPFAALNLFAYGLFAWDPDSDPENVIRTWEKLTYDLPDGHAEALCRLLLKSRSVYEKYAATLGLNWMITPENHYGPNPYGYEFMVWGTYTRADRNAVGTDRTSEGTGFTQQYPEELRLRYESLASCPDELLLFFHRLPYTCRMKDGRTLIQRIYDDHFEGCAEAEAMAEELAELPLPSPDREEAAARMAAQVKNAREWRDVVNTFFYRFCGIPDARGRKIWP